MEIFERNYMCLKGNHVKFCKTLVDAEKFVKNNRGFKIEKVNQVF